MKNAKLIKRHEIAAQQEEKKTRRQKKLAPVNATKQAISTVNSWVKQRQSVKESAYQAFSALFADPQTKGIA